MEQQHNNSTSEFIIGLANSIFTRQWSEVADIDSFTDCWVTLGRISDDNNETLGPLVCAALSNSVFEFLEKASTDTGDNWKPMFLQVEQDCYQRSFATAHTVITQQILSSCHAYIVEPSDLNRTYYLSGWHRYLKEDHTGCFNQTAVDEICATLARLFGHLVLILSHETRQLFAIDLLRLSEDFQRIENQENLQEPVFPVRTTSVKRKKSVRKQDAKSKKSSQRMTPRNNYNWQSDYEAIIACREAANIANLENGANRGKPYYSDSGANHLAEAVARTMQLKPITDGLSPAEWIRHNPDEVIYLDARRVIRHQRTSLERSPQNAVRGRLTAMEKYYSEVSVIGIRRDSTKDRRSPDGQVIDSQYVVVLFRLR